MTKDEAINIAINMLQIIDKGLPYEKRWLETTIEILDDVIYSCEVCNCLHCECDEYE